MTKSIELNRLTIGYPGKRGQTVVMRQLNGALLGGELTCLLGPNGVGKSTLLKTLATFIHPLEGTIKIDGRDLCTMSPGLLAKIIGVVLTAKPEAANLTVEEIVGMGRTPYTGFWGTLDEEDRRVVDWALDLMGIGLLRHRMAGTLSDGESQRMMIAKALAQQTPVIVLDEPTAFLDFPSKVQLMRLLREVAHHTGKIVFMSTHDVGMALQLADCLWIMQKGELSIGTTGELSEQGALSRFLDKDGIRYDPLDYTIKIKEKE